MRRGRYRMRLNKERRAERQREAKERQAASDKRKAEQAVIDKKVKP